MRGSVGRRSILGPIVRRALGFMHACAMGSRIGQWAIIVTMWFCANVVAAQESAALIDVLIRKGILTNQEAEDIRAE